MNDSDEILDEIALMPQEKLVAMYRSCVIEKKVCDECMAHTWLISPQFRNCTDTCHVCGHEYQA